MYLKLEDNLLVLNRGNIYDLKHHINTDKNILVSIKISFSKEIKKTSL